MELIGPVAGEALAAELIAEVLRMERLEDVHSLQSKLLAIQAVHA